MVEPPPRPPSPRGECKLCPDNLENQNFEKMKKTSEDTIILQMCTINDSQMMYSSWDMECNRIFCHFGLFFPLLLHNPENQNFEKLKKMPGDIILHRCTINDNHMTRSMSRNWIQHLCNCYISTYFSKYSFKQTNKKKCWKKWMKLWRKFFPRKCLLPNVIS